MGTQASTYLIGFANAGANREDLIDMITNIDPWETPLFVACPKISVSHVTHEWLTDTLAATSTAGGCEGKDFEYGDSTAPTRLQNVCQIFRKDFRVTNTQRAVNPAGANDWYAYEVQKALREIARNVECRLLAMSGASEGGGTAVSRVMKSVAAFLTTNVHMAGASDWGLNEGQEYVSASATHMTEDRFNTMLEKVFTSGGNPDSVYVSAGVKRQISAFSGQGASRRNIAMAEKKLIASVDMYDSDVGLVNIVLDRWVFSPANTTSSHFTATTGYPLNAGEAYFLETPMIRVGTLRPIRHVPLPPVGDATRGMVVGELTVEVLNEKACGKFWGVSSVGP
jgi:hypothetical protein